MKKKISKSEFEAKINKSYIDLDYHIATKEEREVHVIRSLENIRSMFIACIMVCFMIVLLIVTNNDVSFFLLGMCCVTILLLLLAANKYSRRIDELYKEDVYIKKVILYGWRSAVRYTIVEVGELSKDGSIVYNEYGASEGQSYEQGELWCIMKTKDEKLYVGVYKQ